jgi:hypothetical protein
MGDFKRRGFFFLLACSFFSLDLRAQSLERLQEGLKLAENLLRRVEYGAEACFSESCQQKKSALLHGIYQDGTLLSFLGPTFVSQLQEATRSARRLMRESAQRSPLSPKVPQGVSDWTAAFERRYSTDIERMKVWLGFMTYLESLRISIRHLSTELKKLPEPQKEKFQKLWAQGMVKILKDQRRIQELSFLRDQSRFDGQEAQAENFDQQKLQLMKEVRDWLELNEVSFIEIQREFFSGLDFGRLVEVVSAMELWSQFFQISNILSPVLADKVFAIDQAIKSLQQDAYAFNDLEFGVVGLNNFKTLTHPGLAAGWEAQIQLQLDSKIENLQFMIDFGQSLLLLSASLAIGGSSRFIPWSTFGLASYYQESEDLKISNQIFLPSNRRSQLQDLENFWNSRMDKRYVELRSTQTILQERIEGLKQRIDQLEKGESL